MPTILGLIIIGLLAAPMFYALAVSRRQVRAATAKPPRYAEILPLGRPPVIERGPRREEPLVRSACILAGITNAFHHEVRRMTTAYASGFSFKHPRGRWPEPNRGNPALFLPWQKGGTANLR